MKLNGKTILVCDCEGTMALDGKALAKACGGEGALAINNQLCRAQIDNFKTALAGDAPVLVACTQEARLFAEVAGEFSGETGTETAVGFANIRERAGWSKAGKKAAPKIAALLAEAALDIPPATTVTMNSSGVCLVYGRGQEALEAAQQLAHRLEVTLLLSESEDVIPPRLTQVATFRGTVIEARGHLGAFEVVVRGFAPVAASARAAMEFGPAQDRADSACDLILDLTGGTPLFPAPEKRDGYFNPDPGNPAAVQKAIFEIADLVGEFEKPRYVNYDAGICAHSRSQIIGCNRCIDVCPASAIVSAGDVVEIDPYICGGCGACHSVCPTGAAAYALPVSQAVLERLRTLLSTYAQAGGKQPVLLVHDGEHGEEMISMMARFGRGLPANVLPFAVNEATQVGLEMLCGAYAYGATQIRILVPPARSGETAGLVEQIALAEAFMAGLGYGDGRTALIDEADPDAVEAALYDLPDAKPLKAGNFLPMGNKRALTLLALAHLHKAAPKPVDLLALPEGAPFGTITVDTEGCTLCLACVGACPTGAMMDNPDKPRLSFNESACVQCGLCRITCPEKVIALEPRFNFTDQARGPVVKHEEEPFACIRCGKEFGTKSSIDLIVEKLAGKHPMFAESGAGDVIKMCDDCRVIAQAERQSEVMAGAPRTIRTTDDYLRERELAEQQQAGAKSKKPRKNGEDG